jgi:hypothetical protein
MGHRGLEFPMPKSNALKKNPDWPSFFQIAGSPAQPVIQADKYFRQVAEKPATRTTGFSSLRDGFCRITGVRKGDFRQLALISFVDE